MNVEKSALHDVFNAYVELQVADCHHDSIITTVEEMSVYAIQLSTDVVASRESTTINGIVYISISRMIKSRHLDSNSRTQLSPLARSTMFMDLIVCPILNQKKV